MLRFRLVVCLGAFLLFSVQPLMARRLLPWFGGAPAVWTTCLAFYQGMLLAGYAYAHWVAGRAPAWVHRGLLALSLAFLPLAPAAPRRFERPPAEILWLLISNVGLPYLLLASASPLAQRWWPGSAPYRLYAWSNAAAAFWTARSGRRPGGRPAPARAMANWGLLAGAPSALLLATTNQLCREIAATPFLWLLPLAVYLGSWILTFEREDWYDRTAFSVLAGVAVPSAAALTVAGLAAPLWAHILADSAALFACSMVCHGELARSKPDREQLTAFYLSAAAGGAAGGAAAAWAAPRLFRSYAEFPISLTVCALAGLAAWLRGRHRPTPAALAALLTAAATPALTLADRPPGDVLAARRNFYGVVRVTEQADAGGARRVLLHGRVMHGMQFLDWQKRGWPTTYYGPGTPAEEALERHPRRPGALRAGVIGLGVGTLAAYGRPGDVFRFYEINPAVVELAGAYFTYLKDSPAAIQIALGDARVVLAGEPPQQYDVLAVDAFSSDAIPVHLLTAECAALYRRHLRPGGVLLFHISNQSLDLWPVTWGLARHLGMAARRVTKEGEAAKGTNRSTWVVLSEAGPSDAAGSPLLWTDDFSSLWPVFRISR